MFNSLYWLHKEFAVVICLTLTIMLLVFDQLVEWRRRWRKRRKRS